MRIARLFRSTTFQWAAGATIALMLQTVLVSGFLWLQTSRHAAKIIDRELVGDCAELRQRDQAGVTDAVGDRNNGDLHRTGYAALFGPAGVLLIGNLERIPDGLVADGRPQTAGALRADLPRSILDQARLVACPTLAGDMLVLGRDLNDLAYTRALVTRAITLGLVPAMLIALLVGVLLSVRAQRRIGRVQAATERIIAGQLRERLPVSSAQDPFDRLSFNVNCMLDRIETLMEELRGVGDDIAHELRTPLTRLRAGLERGCREAETPEQFRVVAERAVQEIDQTLGIIAALLRIREIELARRRILFANVELRGLLHDAVELYVPMAEMRGVSIGIDTPAPVVVFGDADLLMEAVANLLDNAVKFTRPGGRVQVRLNTSYQGVVVQISDDGPGIDALERQSVLRRFHRGEHGWGTAGIGIGLSLVTAILTLHEFELTLEDAEPGCLATILCRSAVLDSPVDPRPQALRVPALDERT
ncbi:MAG: ATP-binding protein [Janthinobacterium lividum]